MKIFKDSFIYLIGEVVAKMLPFLLLPYLSHRLGVEGYGELSYYQTYLVLFILIVGFSQEGAISRYFYFYGNRSINLLVISGYIYTFFIGGLLLITFLFLNEKILIYILLAAIFQSILNVQLTIKQCHKQALSYTLIQLSTSIGSTILTILIFELYEKVNLVEKRFIAIFLINIIVSFLIFLFYFKKVKKIKFYSIFYKKYFLFLISFCFPLAFQIISGFFKGNIDRILIYNSYNETILGFYAMGITIATILAVLITAINKASLPYYYESLKNKKIKKNIILKWFWISFIFIPVPAFTFHLIPSYFLNFLFGNGFSESKYYATIFIFAKSLSIPYLILANYLFYYGKVKEISLFSILSTFLYVFLLFFFSKIDIIYIPFSTLLSELFLLFLLYFYIKRIN